MGFLPQVNSSSRQHAAHHCAGPGSASNDHKAGSWGFSGQDIGRPLVLELKPSLARHILAWFSNYGPCTWLSSSGPTCPFLFLLDTGTPVQLCNCATVRGSSSACLTSRPRTEPRLTPFSDRVSPNNKPPPRPTAVQHPIPAPTSYLLLPASPLPVGRAASRVPRPISLSFLFSFSNLIVL